MDPDTSNSPNIDDSPLNPARRTLLLLAGTGALGGWLTSLVAPETMEAKKKKRKKKRRRKRKNKNRCKGSVVGSASAAEEQELLNLINNFRQTQGVTPLLSRNSQLDTAARLHSQDMARRCYFDHISPNGTDPFERMAAAGYTGTPWSENIYMGTGPFKSAAEAFEAWENSTQGHREAMLDEDADEIGIGTALDSDGAMYWTNVFGQS